MHSSPGHALTEQHASSFSLAAQYLPEETRKDVYALYGFCRATDQILDENGTRTEKEHALNEWEKQLSLAWEKKLVSSALIQDFVRVCESYSISKEWGHHLIAGLRADLDVVRMHDFAGLREYCFAAGAIPGILMAHVLGANPASYAHAISLGMGMQLTNILRDIPEDFRNNRVYLPREEMKQFGYSYEDLAASRVNESFIRLMQFNIARARSFYAHAEEGIEDLPLAVQRAIRLSLLFYREILTEIERVNYNVFSGRVFVSEARKRELIREIGARVPASLEA